MPTEKKEANRKETNKKETNKKPTTKKTTKSKNNNQTTEKKATQVKSKKTNTKEKAKSEVKETKKQNAVKTVDMQKMQEVVKQELNSKKTIPEEEQKKMNGEVFKNIIIAIGIVVFLNFIILGFINIQPSVFIVDLKVFAVGLLALAIILFEYAYKKDSGKIAIYGIETLVLSFCMIAFIYISIMLNSKFVVIVVLTTYAIAIYYTVKSAIIYKKMKKQYFIDAMKEIIKK